jgi:hypothetical protein
LSIQSSEILLRRAGVMDVGYTPIAKVGEDRQQDSLPLHFAILLVVSRLVH